MLQPILQSIRSFFRFIMMLVMAAVMGVIAWASWEFYDREHLLQQYNREGRQVHVQVLTAEHERRVWYDQFTSPAYISFKHQGRNYAIRYSQDSGWVSEGDKVTLLYHPGLDDFRQPGTSVHFQRFEHRSRLIDFTIVSFYSDERKWHLVAVVFTAITIVLSLGILGNIIHLPWLQRLWGILGAGLVLLFALYLTYNTAQYFRYYQKIRSTGKVETAIVERTDYRSHSRRSTAWRSYYAEVRFNKGPRLIPIEEDDYDRLRPNDRLPVLYSNELNDMMPVGYQPDYSNLIFVLMVWAPAIFLLWKFVIKRRRETAAV